MRICRFNWGLTVRKKSERVTKLLEEGTLLKEERNICRRLSRGIQGFGSFNQRSTPSQVILREKSLPTTIGRCNSDSNKDVDTVEYFKSLDSKKTMIYHDDIGNNTQQLIQKSESSSKENMEPSKEDWNLNGESKPLLDYGEEDSRLGAFQREDDHPFNSTTEMHTTASLLSARDGILLGC